MNITNHRQIRLVAWLLIAAMLAGTLAACSAQPAASPQSGNPLYPVNPPIPTTAPGAAPAPTADRPANLPYPVVSPMPTTTSASPAVVPPGAEAPLDLIRRDLAARLKTGTDAIRLVRAEAVDWGDSSLGCPKPGMAYAQVITPGYKFILSAGGSEYEYHSDRRAVIVSCP